MRLALFNEEDGSTCLKTLREAGAKVCKRMHSLYTSDHNILLARLRCVKYGCGIWLALKRDDIHVKFSTMHTRGIQVVPFFRVIWYDSKGPYLNDVYTGKGVSKCRRSKGYCVDLVLVKMQTNGGGGPKSQSFKYGP